MTPCRLGVDGGGTRTRALVVGPDAAELARAEGPPAVADGPEHAAGAVVEACRRALAEAGASPPVDALWAGLAGAGREPARAAVEGELVRAGLARCVRVGTDVEAAFHDAFADGPGVLLISGTGSIAHGRAEDGRTRRVGGWGPHLGDEGSGYAIGLEALRRVVRSADGRGPATRLTAVVLAEVGATAAEDLVAWAAAAVERGDKSAVAALAPTVARLAAEGDAAAAGIVTRAVEELERHVLALLDRLGLWGRPPSLALAGGLLRVGRPLRASVEAALARHGLETRSSDPDAARGAARLAMALAEARNRG